MSATPTAQARDRARRSVLVVASLGFFAAGFAQATIGPALPDLARSTGTALAALGSVFTAIYGGGLLGQLATGAIVDRIGHRPVLVAGPVLGAVGMAGIALAPSLPVVLVAGFLPRTTSTGWSPRTRSATASSSRA